MARARRQSELPGAAAMYAELVAQRGEVCWICGNPPKTRRLHIDHDHKTDTVRGLLCFRCNKLTMMPWVTEAWLIRAALYLTGTRIDEGDVATIDLAPPEAVDVS